MAKQLKEIEIPFGAYDSELDGFEYTIPEGYEAEIKDGKIVVKKTGSEDEKMIQYFKDLAPFDKADELYEKYGFSHKDAIAWLEKQGGHAKFINGIQVGDKVTRNEDGVLVNLSQLNRVAKKNEKQGEQKDILEDAILDSNKDGLIADTIRYKREKQSEQKPADKVEPKFYEGEWIIHQGTENIYQVTAIVDNQYQLKYGDNYTTQYCEDVDRCARLWEIAKDAKDGDVLCTYECGKPKIVFILKGMPKKPYVLGYHCYYNIMYPNLEIDSEKGCLAPNDEDIKPATKEQRDTLFAKMKEAGYVWDAEKLELKKIEQNPAETEKGTNGNEREIPYSALSEEDERIIDNLVSQLGNLYARKLIKEETKDKYVNWLKSLKDKSTWKPSDEQMGALDFAIDCVVPDEFNYKKQALKDLLEQLKKLMEG